MIERFLLMGRTDGHGKDLRTRVSAIVRRTGVSIDRTTECANWWRYLFGRISLNGDLEEI